MKIKLMFGVMENKQEHFYILMIVLKGTLRLFESDYSGPVNIGSDEQVSINQMIEIIEEISGYKIEKNYQLDKPKRCKRSFK